MSTSTRSSTARGGTDPADARQVRGNVGVVARREIRDRLRSTAFRYSTLGVLVLIVGLVLMPKFLDGGDDAPPRVATVGVRVSEQGAPGTDPVSVQTVKDAAEARRLVEAGTVEAALVREGGVTKMLQTAKTSPELRQVLSERLRSEAMAAEVASQGLDPKSLQQALAAAEPRPELVGGNTDAGQRTMMALIVTLVLFFQVFNYGVAVATGVVEEKATRVVELLLVTVRPRQLLTGKVLGIGTVGVLQIVLFAVAGFTTAVLADTADVPTDALLATLGASVGWFLLGYTFFAYAFGAAGSLVSRQEEVQSVTLPVTAVAFVGFFATVTSVQNPSAGWIETVSYIPPFSALMMPTQMASGSVSAVAVGVAAGLMVAATALVAWLGSAIYNRTVLRTGQRVGMLKALRGTS